MKIFFKSKTFRVLFGIIAALFVGMIIAVVSSSSVSPFSTALGTVLKPIQSVAEKLADGASHFGSYFAGSKSLQSEIRRLKKQIEDYEEQLADYNEMQNKIKSYEDALELKEEHSDFRIVQAELIGMDSQDAFGSFVINVGSSSGVKVNDPVVCGKYLVGVVKKVNPSYSLVQTIINPGVNIAAIESKTRESAYVSSSAIQSVEGRCLMKGLPRLTKVSPGGIVITSGIGGVFPKGLIIGTVAQVLESEYDVTSYAIVNPGVDFDGLEDVTVIIGFDGQGTPVVE